MAQSKMLEGAASLPNLIEILRESEDADDYVRNTTVEILTTLSSNSKSASFPSFIFPPPLSLSSFASLASFSLNIDILYLYWLLSVLY